MKSHGRVIATLGVVLASLLAGCAPMTPQQAEGVQLRRYCEQNKNDPVKCAGFYGFL